jgi:hypothetical protein
VAKPEGREALVETLRALDGTPQHLRTFLELTRYWREQLGLGMDGRRLRLNAAPDEPRIAQVAEELRAGVASSARAPRDLVLLHLHGEVYTQKPPLYYWLSAALGAPGGRVTEWAARLPSAVAGVLCVALVLAIGRRLFGSSAAVWAAALLLGSHRFIHLAQRAQLDVVLTAFELAALWVWIRVERGELAPGRGIGWLHAFLGAALLTKGPVGLLPLLALALYLGWERRSAELRALLAPRALAISLGPFLIWAALALALAPAGFFQEAVVENFFERVVSGTSHARPWYYYFVQLPIDFAPASLLLPLAGLTAWRALRAGEVEKPDDPTRRAWRLLVAWSGTFLLVFSLSAGKRGLYLMPALPVLALACGAAWAQAVAGRSRLPLRSGIFCAAIATGLAALAFAGLTRDLSELGELTGLAQQLDLEHIGVPPGLDVPRGVWPTLLAICGVALAGGAFLALRGSAASHRAALVLGTVLAIDSLIFFRVYPSLDSERSPRPIALAAAELASAGGSDASEPIGIFAHRSLAPGIEYYSGHPIVLLPDRAAVRRYVEGGGKALIVDAHRSVAAGDTRPLVRRASLRSGQRTVWVLGPARGSQFPSEK